MMFQKDMETMPRKEIEALQLERLKWIVNYCYNNVKLYHDRLEACGVADGSKIKTLKDIELIPFTTKDDFRDNYPFGLTAVPMKDIVRIHASSGTTGKPTVGVYTKEDLDIWSDCVARVAVAGGVSPEDTIQISFGYGLFTGALGLHYGLEKLGCTVIPASSGNTEKQLMMMRDYGVTGLVATPSYAVYLSEAIKNDKGHTRDEYKLKLGILGSEPCTIAMRQQIEDNLGIRVSDNYGMTELGGPGVSGDCEERNGMHIAEDHFFAEICDKETGKQLGENEVGELIITTLTRKGMPVLRYKTKDITKINYDPCPCGRTTARMAKTMGRTDDMLIIKGVNVFPTQIENILINIDGIAPHYQLVITRKDFKDSLEIKCEIEDAKLLEDFKILQAKQEEISAKMHSILGLRSKITIVAPNTIERFQGKAKRIVDLRGIK